MIAGCVQLLRPGRVEPRGLPGVLHQFHENAAGGPGVEERHPVPPRAVPGGLVDELDPVGPQAGEVGRQVGAPEGHVVEAGTAAGEEAAHQGVGVQGLQELHLAAEGHPDSLGLERLGPGTGDAGEALEEAPSFLQRGDGQGHVVHGALADEGGSVEIFGESAEV